MSIRFFFLTFHEFCLIFINTIIPSLLHRSEERKKFTDHIITLVNNIEPPFLLVYHSNKTTATMVNNTNNVWRLLWTLIHKWFYTTFIHFYIIHMIFIFRKNKNKDNDTPDEKSKSTIYFFFKYTFYIKSKKCLKSYLNRINRQTSNIHVYIYIGYNMNCPGRRSFCVFY